MTTIKPTTKIVGYQSWRNLLFVHWKVDPQQIQDLLPNGLTVETFDETAWLAVVPFSMERVRPWWSLAVPGISWFLETNLRTYVRHENGQTGVWFFSLDANHRLAVAVARRFWYLNYRFAKMTMHADDDQVTYNGQRSQPADIGYNMTADVDASQTAKTAHEDSLEYFLLERYHLFAQKPDGTFLCGQVDHDPYRFQSVRNCTVTQTLTDALDQPIHLSPVPDHVVYSPGVDVRVSSLTAI